MRKDYGKVDVPIKVRQKTKEDLDKEWDRLVATGEEGRKGIEQAKQIFKGDESEAKKIKDEEMSRLFDKRRTFFGYNETIARMLYRNIQEAGVPPGWIVKVAHTSEGVIMELESPNKRYFRSAFRTSGDPVLDSNAVDNFVIRAINTMEKIWTPPSDRK